MEFLFAFLLISAITFVGAYLFFIQLPLQKGVDLVAIKEILFFYYV